MPEQTDSTSFDWSQNPSKVYQLITEEYIANQTKLGIQDPLVKFIEWRLYIECFGSVLSESDKALLHTIAVKMAKSLPAQYKSAMLYWLNHESISENITDAMNTMLRHFLLGLIGYSSQIFNVKEYQTPYEKDAIDLEVEKMYLSDPIELMDVTIKSENTIDARLFELREWITHRQLPYPERAWILEMNDARMKHEDMKGLIYEVQE